MRVLEDSSGLYPQRGLRLCLPRPTLPNGRLLLGRGSLDARSHRGLGRYFGRGHDRSAWRPPLSTCAKGRPSIFTRGLQPLVPRGPERVPGTPRGRPAALLPGRGAVPTLLSGPHPQGQPSPLRGPMGIPSGPPLPLHLVACNGWVFLGPSPFVEAHRTLVGWQFPRRLSSTAPLWRI